MEREAQGRLDAEGGFEDFVAAHRRPLRNALVARYGPEVGDDALAAALEYAWREWASVSTMSNPAGYLY